MITEEVQMIKVEPAIIQRAENLARKTYKVANWLKVISMYLENENYDEVEKIIKNEIHENFIMQEGFWEGEIKRKVKKETFTHDDASYLLLALEDGPYFVSAAMIVNRAVEVFKNDKKRANFALSIIEKIIVQFNHDKVNGSFFYKKLREIYEMQISEKKLRQSYEREIKQSFDDVDLTYDAYM
jgi:hypothetical protein